MSLLLTALVVISALLMVGVILLQQGKGAELGAAFGRGAQGGLFGSTGSANFLTRTTKWLAVAFLGSALTLSLFVSDSSREGVLDELRRESQSESVLIESEADADSDSVLVEADPAGSDSETVAEEDAADADADPAVSEETAEETRTPD